MKPALFLDRDGTLIEHVHYLCDPRDVALVQGVARSLRELRRAGFLCVVVTNQAAVAKGMLTLSGLDEIHRRVDELLAAEGAAVDGWYFCTEERRSESQEVIDHPDRKPGAGMLLRAARELGVVLSESWMVGDSLSDALAGRNAGCRGSIVVRTGLGHCVDAGHPGVDAVVEDLPAAVRHVLRHASGDRPREDDSP